MVHLVPGPWHPYLHVHDVPRGGLRQDGIGNAVERHPVAGHGEAPAEPGNRRERALGGRSQQDLQGVQRAGCHDHPPRPQSVGASLAPVVEPHLVATPGHRRDRLHRAQVPHDRPDLHRGGDQRPVHAQFRADVAAEHAAVAQRARRPDLLVVAGPADALRRRPQRPPFLVADALEHGELALVLRPGSDLEPSLDSLEVGHEFRLRQFGRQGVVELRRGTLQVGAADHRVAADGRGIHDDRALVKRRFDQAAAATRGCGRCVQSRTGSR